jgi:hypothetical protein
VESGHSRSASSLTPELPCLSKQFRNDCLIEGGGITNDDEIRERYRSALNIAVLHTRIGG